MYESLCTLFISPRARFELRLSNWKKPGSLMCLASAATCSAVGLFSRLIVKCFNAANCHNEDRFFDVLERRPDTVPLVTVSNHYSCIDDPCLWGCLNLKQLSSTKMRWSLAADDICFTNKFNSWFFLLGRCLPIVRGNGVYQETMNFCINQLNKGQWVHIFPEGQVNMAKECMRLKWGVGRLIYDSSVTPLVVPIWHLGFDEVLPNEPPYYLKFGKQITINFGMPLDLSCLVKQLKSDNISPVIARKIITEVIQRELHNLQVETEPLHFVHKTKVHDLHNLG